MNWMRSNADRVRQSFLSEERRDWLLEHVRSGLDQMIRTRRAFLNEAAQHRAEIHRSLSLENRKLPPGPDWEWFRSETEKCGWVPVGYGRAHEPLAPHELVNPLIDPTGFPCESPEAIAGVSRPQCQTLETNCVLATAIHDRVFPHGTFGLRHHSGSVADGLLWGEYSKLVRRVHEIPQSALASINEIVAGVISAADTNLDGPFLGLVYDRGTRTVKRFGVEETVVLTKLQSHIFEVLFKARDGDSSVEELMNGYPGDWTAKDAAMSALRKKLAGLDVVIPRRKYHLRDKESISQDALRTPLR